MKLKLQKSKLKQLNNDDKSLPILQTPNVGGGTFGVGTGRTNYSAKGTPWEPTCAVEPD